MAILEEGEYAEVKHKGGERAYEAKSQAKSADAWKFVGRTIAKAGAGIKSLLSPDVSAKPSGAVYQSSMNVPAHNLEEAYLNTLTPEEIQEKYHIEREKREYAQLQEEERHRKGFFDWDEAPEQHKEGVFDALNNHIREKGQNTGLLDFGGSIFDLSSKQNRKFRQFRQFPKQRSFARRSRRIQAYRIKSPAKKKEGFFSFGGSIWNFDNRKKKRSFFDFDGSGRGLLDF